MEDLFSWYDVYTIYGSTYLYPVHLFLYYVSVVSAILLFISLVLWEFYVKNESTEYYVMYTHASLMPTKVLNFLFFLSILTILPIIISFILLILNIYCFI